MLGYWLLFFVSLMLSAFFSGTEIGFLSANKFRIALRDRPKDVVGSLLNNFIQNSNRFITTILIGNNLALVLYGIAVARILDPWLLRWFEWDPKGDAFKVLAAETAISTLIVLIFAEYLPKAVYRTQPDRLLTFSARPMRFFYLLLTPVVIVAEAFAKFLLNRLFKIETDDKQQIFTREALYEYVTVWAERDAQGETSTDTADVDPQLIRNAMTLNETRVREFMVPRTEIVGLPSDATLEELHKLFIETEFSRIVLYEDSLDNVVGYVHTSELFRKPNSLMDARLPVMIIPETMTADVLLEEFSTQQRSLGIVVDEFGGTAGLVTLEDLVEEVFGDIEDEHDEDEEGELFAREVDENTWEFSGRWEVDDINQEYGLELPEHDGDYATLSGLALHYLERFPKVGEKLVVGDYTLMVIRASANTVEIVRVHRERGRFDENGA